MTNDEITPEQYKAQQLKRNMTARFSEYEDAIATLQTQNAMLQQQVEHLKTLVPDEELEGAVGELTALDAPDTLE